MPLSFDTDKTAGGQTSKGAGILKVLANDPVAPQNIDAWAKKSGNELLEVEVFKGNYNIFVRKS